MRKILGLLIVVLMLLMLTACGDETETDKSAETGASLAESTGDSQPTEAATEEASSAGEVTQPTEAGAKEDQPGGNSEGTPPTTGKPAVEEITPTESTQPETTIPTACSHTYSPANCTAVKTCSKCGATEGAAKGHSWGAWEVKKAAEVGKAGAESRKCTACQETETREIPALEEDATRAWFVDAYKQAKQQYISEKNQKLQGKQDKIDEINGKIDTLYANYLREVERIKANYPEGPNRDFELSIVYTDYSFSLEVYTDQIDMLEREIAEMRPGIDNPNPHDILEIVSKNCNISNIEALDYYAAYYESLS